MPMLVVSSMAMVVGVANGAVPAVTIGQDVHGADVVMPLVGAGTWQYNDSVAYDSVCKAFAAGYTFVDTANGYRNQKGVGQAIRDCWKGTREELFVMTKIPGGLNTSETLAAHRENMEQLGLDYVDHLMTHFPADWAASPERATPQRRQEEWKSLESIYKTVRPSVNQVEYHVGAGDVDQVIEKCAAERIFFMSYSPLCGPCDYKPEDSLINGELVTSVAEKYNVTGAQVSLRWIVQQALAGKYIGGVIPKSNDAKHIASNFDIFGFELSDEDMQTLSSALQPAGEPGDCDVTLSV